MSGDDLELRLAWQQHVGRSADADAVFESLLARHREPHRHYHGVRHVVWMVRHLTGFIRDDVVDDAGAVVAAAFFHDAVYEPTASDNEAASARLATGALDALGWPSRRTAHIAAMIEATAQHDVEGADADTACLLAADLAVLAADPTRYDDYTRAVRREYAHVDDEAWRIGRSAVLQTLLTRDAIFAPALRLDAWESRARANMAAELRGLTG